MEKRKGLRAGISSIRQDYRSGGLVSKEGPRLQFNTGSLVKTKQQFYSEYEQEKGRPPTGGKSHGAKRRANYFAAQDHVAEDRHRRGDGGREHERRPRQRAKQSQGAQERRAWRWRRRPAGIYV